MSFSDRSRDKDALRRIAGRALGQDLDTISFVEGGANNTLARAESGSQSFVIKAYFHDPDDPRDRLGAEYGMLSFLWEHGVRCIPQPIACDKDERVGVYEFVQGTKPVAGDVSHADIEAMSELLHEMWMLRGEADAAVRPRASESCFSVSEYIAVVQARRSRLLDALVSSSSDVPKFLTGAFDKVFEEACDRAGEGQELMDMIPDAERTLSPSDHGFHNMMRTPDGRCVFFDFEYSGWDDTAKMLTDACLQPAVPMPLDARREFLSEFLDRIDASEAMRLRLRRAFPLLGLNWCLIMLSGFDPVVARRREFAGQDVGDEERLAGQLDGAKSKLVQVRRDMVDNDLFA